MVGDGFVRIEIKGIPYFACRSFLSFPFLRHGFSTRRGGVSGSPEGVLNLGLVSWDTAEAVNENRRRFLAALDIEHQRLATLAQNHSDLVHILEENGGQWNPQTRGDSLVTRRSGIALAVQVADCFPVLMLEPDSRTIASCHSGWRGTLGRIAPKTVAQMAASSRCAPSEILVAVGPGIRSCCFEVGNEVVAAFEDEFPDAGLARPHPERAGKFLLDLPRALEVQLRESGVSAEHIFDLGLCTMCLPEEFFSYRREGSRTGRMMGLIAQVS